LIIQVSSQNGGGDWSVEDYSQATSIWGFIINFFVL